jgi:dienelactone hydrolase
MPGETLPRPIFVNSHGAAEGRWNEEVARVVAASMWRTNAFIAVAAASSAVSATALFLVRDPSARFEQRRAGLASVSSGPVERLDSSLVQSIRVADSSGLVVDLTWRRHAADSARRLPLAVVLGGHVRGKDAVRLVGDTRGIMVAAVSYPFDGDVRPSAATFLRQIPKIRGAFLDTPPALRLALDHLHQRDDVDPGRIEAIGVSLGAPFMTIAGALDQRFSRVWAIHGSGGSYAPLEASMRQSIDFAPLRVLAAGIANVIIAGPSLSPERWVKRISPRPFMMVNALDDERMPRESVEALYDSAAHPKEIIWMSGQHVHGDAPTIQRLVAIVLERVRSEAN